MQSNSRDIPKTCMNCKFDTVGGMLGKLDEKQSLMLLQMLCASEVGGRRNEISATAEVPCSLVVKQWE